MKNTLITIIAVAGLYTGADAQITIAPEAGLNMANMAMKVTDLAGGSFKYGTKARAGLAAGAVVDIPIVKGLSLQPGLFYEMTGTTFTETDNNPSGHWDMNALTVPVNIEYKTGHPGGNRFFAGVGPYIAYAFSGSYTYNADQNLGTYDATGALKIGSDKGKDDIKALDFGVGVNAGYMIAMGLYLRAHYQLGLTNLCPFADTHDSYKTSGYGLTIGYVIGAKKGGEHKSVK